MKFSIEEQKKIMQAGRYSLIDFSIITNRNYKPGWHHEEISQGLELVEKGQIKRLIIQMPPRHGKSQLATINFPAWYIGRNPEKEIITASYSADLAQDFGAKTRDLVNSENYHDIFETRLKEDEQARGKWRTTEGGSYIATGVGGPITGRGANCFPVGTLITTDKGKIPIEYCNNRTRVVSYNNDKDILEIKPIKATLKRAKKGFIEITTIGGRRITSTDDHRFFVIGKGYIKAKKLKKGERVRILPITEKSHSYLFSLQERIFKGMGRIYQESSNRAEGFLLRSKMFGKTPFIQKQQKMSDLWKDSKEGKHLLFTQVYSFLQKIKKYSLFILWDINKTIKPFNKILFNGLQEQLSFACNEGQTKSKLQTWIGFRKISERISKEKVCNREGQKSGVCYLQNKEEFSNSSQRQQSEKQQRRKSGCGMQQLPYETPQLQEDTISSITSFKKELDVYDIQVEENHNFFAEDILVHNCLIIDDPIKNREEADSEVIREKVWNWYISTAYTRLDQNGAIIIIATRWHLDDLIGRILKAEQEGGEEWFMISFPAIATEDEEHRKMGEALWPERFDLTILENIKRTIGPYEWQALYQQMPVLTEGQEFKKEWIINRDEQEVRAMDTRKYLTVDPALSKKDSADYTGFCDNAVDKENFWNLKAWRERLDPNDLVEKLFFLHGQRNYEKIGIEKTAYLDGLKPYIDDQMRKRNKFLPIEPLSHRETAKEIRIRALIPRYASRSVFHIKSECHALEEEMFTFPKGMTDDVLDAVAYQLQLAHRPFDSEPMPEGSRMSDDDPYRR